MDQIFELLGQIVEDADRERYDAIARIWDDYNDSDRRTVERLARRGGVVGKLFDLLDEVAAMSQLAADDDALDASKGIDLDSFPKIN